MIISKRIDSIFLAGSARGSVSKQEVQQCNRFADAVHHVACSDMPLRQSPVMCRLGRTFSATITENKIPIRGEDMDVKPSFPADLAANLADAGVIAVLLIDRIDDAVPLAEALMAGGVRAIELTLRTPVALDCIKPIRQAVPTMIVGVGTILSAQQVRRVAEADAAFGVAPGTNPATIDVARRVGLPFAPGVCTPTDIELALQADCTLLKFFPCGPCGGLAYLRSIAAPFSHLGVRFIPLGGIDLSNARDYLDERLVQAIGGSWIAPRAVIEQRDWERITKNAADAMSLVERVRRDRSGVAR
jgi:2-dehydro-3-deoxyphosphogluconate aldolase / (4S)-4-hydroxy-2-oxoglutarate aldolase